MLRRSPLKAKRDKPRRNEGRVVQERMKRKATSKTAQEAAHIQRVASLGCVVTGAPAVLHHIMSAPNKRCRRDHRWIVPLSPELHNMGNQSVHMLGSEEAFKRAHGVDLVQIALQLWEESR